MIHSAGLQYVIFSWIRIDERTTSAEIVITVTVAGLVDQY